MDHSWIFWCDWNWNAWKWLPHEYLVGSPAIASCQLGWTKRHSWFNEGSDRTVTREGSCGDVWCWYKITRSNTWVDVFGVLIMFLVLISKAAFCIKKHIPFIRPSSSSSDPLTLNLKPTRQPVRYCALVRLSLASGRRFGMVGHSSSNWNLGLNLGELNTKKAKLHVLWHPSSFWNQSLGILWNMNI